MGGQWEYDKWAEGKRLVIDNWDAWIWDLEGKTAIDDRVQSLTTRVDGWDGIEEHVIGDEEVKDLRGPMSVLHGPSVRMLNSQRT